MVTGIKDQKQVAHLLTGLGAQTYANLKNLVAPKAPKDCTMVKIMEVLTKISNPNHPSLQSGSPSINVTNSQASLSMSS